MSALWCGYERIGRVPDSNKAKFVFLLENERINSTG